MSRGVAHDPPGVGFFRPLLRLRLFLFLDRDEHGRDESNGSQAAGQQPHDFQMAPRTKPTAAAMASVAMG